MLVATVALPLPDALAVVRDPGPADLIEVRLDAWWPTPPDADEATDALMAAVDAARLPLVATLRPRRQGGAYDGPEDVRLGLLVAAARAGFRHVDLEGDLATPAPVIAMVRDADGGIISSDHAAPGTPSRDEGLRRLTALQDLAADHQKLAVPTGSFADHLRCLELVHAHAARRGRPAVAPLPGSALLRAALAVAGNTLTYGHARGAPPAAPGQPAADAVAALWRHWGMPAGPPSDHHPWLAVLGHPVAHSLSPRLHNAALIAAGRPERYGALEVPDSIAAMRLVATVAPRLGLAAASVTAPHKKNAAQVAACDDTARAVGAANALRFAADGAQATNTDATAFRRLLRDASGTVAVLGAGGAARAALWAARQSGLGAVCASRDPDRAAAAAADFGSTWAPWGRRDDIEADVWIQATPAPITVPRSRLAGASLVIELAYDGAGTLVQDAEEAGVACVDGRRFLLEQAVDAYTWWFGAPPERDAMTNAVLPAPEAAA